MNPDIFGTPIVLFFIGISGLFIFFIFLLFIILTKSRNWCLITFTIGKFFQSIGVFCFSLRLSLPDIISETIGAILIVIGYAFEVFSITSSDLVFRKKKYYLLLLSTILFVLLFTLFINLSDYHQGILFSFAGLFYFGYGGTYLILLAKKSKFKKWIGGTYQLFALVYLVNIISILLQKENYALLQNDSAIALIVRFTAYLVILVGSIGLLLILREQNIQIILNDNNKLQKINSTKDKFFSIIAHDLRGPVGSLYQLIQLIVIEQNEIKPDERKKLLQEIYENSKNTFNLLENLLQWSRSESGRLTYNPSMVNLLEIANSTLALLKDQIHSKQQKVTLNFDAGDTAFADENMLSTVFRNLLSNAVKFTPKNGKIMISTSKMKNTFIKVSVKDTGLGIDKELQHKLFEIQFEHTTRGTENESGSGLGLKLCKEFAIKNGGDIFVESEAGKGSTFGFTLPIEKQQEAI